MSDKSFVNADLHGAQMAQADLSNRELTGANLNKADLRRANLCGAYVVRSYQYGLGLSDAGLCGGTLKTRSRRPDAPPLLYKAVGDRKIPLLSQFTEADLSKADLREAQLFQSDFSGACLHEASLVQANVHLSDFRGANLARANLTEANFAGCDLTNANLTRCKLSRASLVGTTMFETILDQAIVDSPAWLDALLRLRHPPRGLSADDWIVCPHERMVEQWVIRPR
jgi:uncharacterized protein YjbI with pentapeptide repeats